METINGYAVVAEKPSRYAGERVILAVIDRGREGEAEGNYEYVVARARTRREQPTHWEWGNYTYSLARALDVFDRRD